MAARRRKKRTSTVKSKAYVQKPRLSFDDLHDRGKKALSLINEFKVVQKRLPEGLLATLRADLKLLLPGQTNSIITAQALRAARQAQDEAMVDLYKCLSAVRVGIIKTTTDRAIRAAYGLSIRLNVGSLPRLTAAGKKLVKHGNDQPDEARGLGILKSDLTNIEALITRVVEADKKQRELIIARPKATQARNAAGNRVWKAIVTISSRGVMAFPLDEEKRARFDVLDDRPKKPAPKGRKPAEVQRAHDEAAADPDHRPAGDA